jgi:hypothetical protein
VSEGVDVFNPSATPGRGDREQMNEVMEWGMTDGRYINAMRSMFKSEAEWANICGETKIPYIDING